MAELFTTNRDVPGKSTGWTKFKNRNRMEIVANLLSIAKNGALKTHLMYRANLSYLMVTEYLDFLCRSNLIKETVDVEGITKVFQTTEKGLKYLDVYDSLQSIVGLNSHKAESKSDMFA
ncbi:MAG: winged helix-turn-helix domain-containing protein [archaeon]|nr:winged helix-turn-helix domain-containing protein [archaeon]